MNQKYRETLQTQLVCSIIDKNEHASNSLILEEARKTMPIISATTVHRITKRLVKNGKYILGPKINGVIVIDKNIQIHDHFVCSDCGQIKDIEVSKEVRELLKKQAKMDCIPQSLLIIGECHSCK